MNNENTNYAEQHYTEDEISLRQLVKSLIEYRRFIFGFTGIVTLIAIVYLLSLPTFYIVKSSFTKPSESSVLQLNKAGVLNETTSTVYSTFLNKLNNKELQKKIFIEGDYLNKLNKENKPIVDVLNLSDFLNSISLEIGTLYSNDSLIENRELIVTNYEEPSSISILVVEANTNLMVEFINELIAKVDNEIISDYIRLFKQKINYRLSEIESEREWLLSSGEQMRLSQIKIIKEEDTQKLREIKDQIQRARTKEKQTRLNQIVVLTDAAKLAGSLGIIENNFAFASKKVEIDDKTESSIIADPIVLNNVFPIWYLYGEKALLERVKILENRANDDPYIPELVNLNKQLNEIQNNTLLQKLEERQDDSPFIFRSNKLQEKTNLIHELYSEKIKLESIIIELNGLSSMQLTQSANVNIIGSNKRTILVVALFGSFFLSIVVALLINLFRKDETEPTSK